MVYIFQFFNFILFADKIKNIMVYYIEMDAYEKNLSDELSELMLIDGFAGKDKVTSLIRQIFSTKTYIEIVKKDLDKILEDKKIDQNDIPKIMILILKAKNIIPNVTNIKETISTDQMKYIVYATMYTYLKQYCADIFKEMQPEAFRLLFSSMWDLVKINPETINLIKEKIGGCCS
jgi:hypothetical protein